MEDIKLKITQAFNDRALIGSDGHYSIADVWGESISGIKDPNAVARRMVAAWNACAGVPTSELEANGATAGFWGRACARLKGKNDKLKAENAALRAALRNVLSTGLNGGNNVRLAFISASQKPLSDEDIERAEKSEIATNLAWELLTNDKSKPEQ